MKKIIYIQNKLFSVNLGSSTCLDLNNSLSGLWTIDMYLFFFIIFNKIKLVCALAVINLALVHTLRVHFRVHAHALAHTQQQTKCPEMGPMESVTSN